MNPNTNPATAVADLSEPRNCLCAALSRAQRAVHRRYEAVLKTKGVTPGQFTILTTLERAGETTISNLAKIMGIDRTTLTRSLVPLVRAGRVADRSEKDQRVRRLALTAKGRRAQAAAARSWQLAQADFITALGEDNAEILLEKLRIID